MKVTMEVLRSTKSPNQACPSNWGKVLTDGSRVVVCVRLSDGDDVGFQWIALDRSPDRYHGEWGASMDSCFFEVDAELIIREMPQGEDDT